MNCWISVLKSQLLKASNRHHKTFFLPTSWGSGWEEFASVSGWAAWDEPASLRAATSTVWWQAGEEGQQQSWRRQTSWTPPPGKGWWRCCGGRRWWSTGCLWCGRRRGQTGVLGTAGDNTAPPPWWCWSPHCSDICAGHSDLFRRREQWVNKFVEARTILPVLGVFNIRRAPVLTFV